jgi:hypothetical protein
VPVLPIIDFLILMGWTALMIGAALKAIDMTTRYHPVILGLSSMDFAVIAAVCFGFALTLAARTWVRLNEHRLISLRRSEAELEARRRVHGLEAPSGLEEAGAEEVASASALPGADRS